MESLNWLLYSLGGSTLPIWLGGYVLLPIFNKHFHWVEYGQHGEFALYTAALIAPTLRLIARDVEDFEFVRRQLFLFIGWIILTMSVAIYSGVITAENGASSSGGVASFFTLNTTLLFKVSLSLFICTAGFSFLVTLIDYQRVGTREIFSAQLASERRLEETFDVTAPETSKPVQQGESEESLSGEPADTSAAEGAPATEPGTEAREKLERDFDTTRGDPDGR